MPSTSSLASSSWEPWRSIFLVALTVPLAALVWFLSSGKPAPPPGPLEVRFREQAAAIGRVAAVAPDAISCNFLGKIVTLTCAWPASAEPATLGALSSIGWLLAGQSEHTNAVGEVAHETAFTQGRDRALLHCKRPPSKAECHLSLAQGTYP
jgi:hypothetical protein